MRDPRHKNLFILGYENISERIYGEWRMGYATLTESNKRTFLKYSSTSVFNPYDLTAENALKFMTDLHSAKLAAGANNPEDEPKKGVLGNLFSR